MIFMSPFLLCKDFILVAAALKDQARQTVATPKIRKSDISLKSFDAKTAIVKDLRLLLTVICFVNTQKSNEQPATLIHIYLSKAIWKQSTV